MIRDREQLEDIEEREKEKRTEKGITDREGDEQRVKAQSNEQGSRRSILTRRVRVEGGSGGRGRMQECGATRVEDNARRGEGDAKMWERSGRVGRR